MASLPALDRNTFIPLYHQIQQRLLHQIHSGALKPGEPLPSAQDRESFDAPEPRHAQFAAANVSKT
jgi:hypothetical protein